MISDVAKHPSRTVPVAEEQRPLSELLRLPAGPVDLSTLATDATVGFPAGGKADAADVDAVLQPQLEDLQERLFASGRATPESAPRVLLVLQGMDTSGKGGMVRHVLGMVEPQGVDHATFGTPTEEERAHPFLWRVEKKLPRPGQIGVFDRSHYEDVLVQRVRKLSPPEVIEKRLAAARTELAAESEFDVTLVNTSVEDVVAELLALVS